MGDPQRIQRKRSKGWRMPGNAVYVGRPSIWGNPFSTAAEFREWLSGDLIAIELEERRKTILKRIQELRGKDLACWCSPGRVCHADVLLKLANK